MTQDISRSSARYGINYYLPFCTRPGGIHTHVHSKFHGATCVFYDKNVNFCLEHFFRKSDCDMLHECAHILIHCVAP
jgi:hypothetical protein